MKFLTTRTALTAAMLMTTAAVHADTASFADGVGGYTGATDIYIPRVNGASGAGPTTALATDNPPVDELWIDQDGTNGVAYGAIIYQFADVFGAGAGQVDLGAEIVSASLSLSSGVSSGSAGTNSDPRVHGLLGPTSVSTTFEDLSGISSGDQLLAGSYLYPKGSGGLLTPWTDFRDGHAGATTEDYDVTSYIRSISSGDVAASNLALLATNNGTDGWQLFTSIALTEANRPTLTIEYNNARIQQTSVLNSGSATIVELGNQGADTTTVKTSGGVGVDNALDQADDPDGLLEQHFEQGLIKFDLNSVLPSGADLQQARLVLTTAIASNAQSGDNNNVDGGMNVRQMLVDWDTTTLPSELGSQFGVQVSEGEASTAYVDMNGNFFDGSSVGNAGFDSIAQGEEFVFDVTGIVQNWLDGENNYGFVVSKLDNDGWQFEAGDVALYLDYTTAVPEPSSLALLGLGALLIARRRRG